MATKLFFFVAIGSFEEKKAFYSNVFSNSLTLWCSIHRIEIMFFKCSWKCE